MFEWFHSIDLSTWASTALTVLGWTLSLIMTLVVIPYLRRLQRFHKEQANMIKKKLFEHTGVVIYGTFDGKLQSDYLGGFLTTLFGEVLFERIVHWNDRPSSNIIVPATDFEADHMEEMLAAHASPYILQSAMIGCYFRNVKRYGTKHYPFAKLVVGLARPDAQRLTSHDYPRIIAIEEAMLRAVLEDRSMKPQWETPEGYTWLETVRDLGKRYFAGKQQGIAVLEVPIPQGGKEEATDSYRLPQRDELLVQQD